MTLTCLKPAGWLYLLGILGYAGHACADDITLPEQLIGTTQGFLEYAVEDYISKSDIEGRTEIEVNALDPRVRMPLCDTQLSSKLQSPAEPIGRVTVKVSCEGSSPWTVYVPAQVHLYRTVVVITRPMQRGMVLDTGDVALRERDVSQLNLAYITDIDQAVGQKLARGMVQDQILGPVQLERAELVHKGDSVVISAQSSGISVRMPGEALADGGLDEQIRVRNENSNRVVKARVTGPGQVEVSM